MKHKHFYSILLLTACLMGRLNATAQHKTVVYGSLGVENVNISISNSLIGTSTDVLGRYALALEDRTKTVNLYYSSIGYQDTIVSLSPKQLQHDSINISFSMRFKDYALNEVTVQGNRPEIAYAGNKTSIVDYEINDMGIYIIGYRDNGCLLLHMSLEFDTLSILPINEKFQKLHKDVYGQIHLISYDSAYQIGHRQYRGEYMKTELFYGMTSDRFHHTFGNNAAATGKVFITYKKRGKEMHYYCHKKGEPKAFLWETSLDSTLFKQLNNNTSNMCVRVYENPVFNNNDTLYFFNFDQDRIVIYNDEAERISTVPMTFHRRRTWNGEWEKLKSWERFVMMDAPRNKFYTAFEEEGIMTIKEIDIKTGKASDVVQLTNFHFVKKPKIHNGILYFLYPTGYDHRKAMYQVRID